MGNPTSDLVAKSLWSFLTGFFALWQLWVFLLLVALVRVGFALYEQHRLRRAGLPEIDRMSGLEFEKKLVVLFQ